MGERDGETQAVWIAATGYWEQVGRREEKDVRAPVLSSMATVDRSDNSVIECWTWSLAIKKECE